MGNYDGADRTVNSSSQATKFIAFNNCYIYNSLNALAINEPLEYARLVLDGEMHEWMHAIDSLEVWSTESIILKLWFCICLFVK